MLETHRTRNLHPVTNLPDMYAFQKAGDRLLEEDAERDDLVVVYFDVDNFKLFNTTYGRRNGDIALRKIAAIIHQNFPEQMTAHFGDDHFAVMASENRLDQRLNRIHNIAAGYDNEVRLELKAGISRIKQGESVLDAADRARIACDTIKHTYDQPYVFYDENMGRSLLDRKYIVDNIRKAIEQSQIRVYYQPIVRILSNELSGLEALARWEDPIYGLLSPARFIETLENAHLIHLLDIEIARQVVQNLKDIQEAGEVPVPVSVNLSRLDFKLCDIVNEIDTLVTEAGISREYIDIEITERALSEDDGTLKNALSSFRKLGYKIWMDDFGSVYSSLNVLKDYDFDVLKMDMQFLANSGTTSEEKGKIILQSIVNMAKELGIQTLCEGVETKDNLDFLHDLGCEKAQGYFFHKPAPLSEIRDKTRLHAYGSESRADRQYMDQAGKINFSSKNPLAMFENNGHDFRVLQKNRAFDEFLRQIGIDDIGQISQLLNTENIKLYGQFERALYKSFHDDKTVSLDLILNGDYCNFQIQGIEKNMETGEKLALVTAMNLSRLTPIVNTGYLDRVLRSLYTVFERIDLFDFEKMKFKTVFCNSGRYSGEFDGEDLEKALQRFALLNIHPEDRARYLRMYDVNTMVQNIRSGGQRYDFTFLRTKDQYDHYTWQAYISILARLDGREVVMSAVCDANTTGIQAAHMLEKENHEGSMIMPEDYVDVLDSSRRNKNVVTGEVLLNAIMDGVPLGFFWKDADRRFLGANRFFKEYYGFTSDSDFIGKTDEEMGWHVDPEPFKNDEYRVIHYGEEVVNAPGTCISRGQVRNILASKSPIYEGTQIIGLVGYFIDVTEDGLDTRERISYTDDMTGLMDSRGLLNTYHNYLRAYDERGIDFAVLRMDLENLREGRRDNGNAWADELIRNAAAVIRNTVGNSSASARTEEGTFIVITQVEKDTDMEILRSRLASSLSGTSGLEKITVTMNSWVYSQIDQNEKDSFLTLVLERGL